MEKQQYPMEICSGTISQLLGIVVTFIDTANYKNAHKWLDVALSYNEKYLPNYYYLLGFISLRKNDPQSAELYFLKSIELIANKSASYLLGKIYFDRVEREHSLSMYKKAQESLMEVLKVDPQFYQVSILLANTYVALGDKERARKYARSAL